MYSKYRLNLVKKPFRLRRLAAVLARAGVRDRHTHRPPAAYYALTPRLWRS
jgi:hypothetical protein